MLLVSERLTTKRLMRWTFAVKTSPLETVERWLLKRNFGSSFCHFARLFFHQRVIDAATEFEGGSESVRFPAKNKILANDVGLLYLQLNFIQYFPLSGRIESLFVQNSVPRPPKQYAIVHSLHKRVMYFSFAGYHFSVYTVQGRKSQTFKRQTVQFTIPWMVGKHVIIKTCEGVCINSHHCEVASKQKTEQAEPPSYVRDLIGVGNDLVA